MQVSSYAIINDQLDYPTALWAAFRLGAIPSCANPIYTPTELVHQLKLSKSSFILTHPLFIESALEAAKQVGIPESRIFLVQKGDNLNFVTVPDLVVMGKTAPEIIPLKLSPEESKKRVALLNFSSGTSGLPKGVLISHYNVIANICQIYALESSMNTEGTLCNGCLPFFHSIIYSQNSLIIVYGLVVIMHAQLCLGHTIVIQPAFAPDTFVEDIHKYPISPTPLIPDTKSPLSLSFLPSSWRSCIVSHPKNSNSIHP